MSSNKKSTVVEPDSAFYERWTELNLELGEAEKNLTIYTDGLSALEKRLMQSADDDFYNNHGKKRLPEYLQRREAKANPLYVRTIKAKAAALARKTVIKGQIEMMKMQFEEWRTRSANNRYAM